MTTEIMRKKTTRTRNAKKQPTLLNSHEKPILHIVGNTLWILANDSKTELEQTLTIREFKQPLPIEWLTDRNVFLTEMLMGYNLLENGDFTKHDKKSLKGWAIDVEQSASAGVDLTEEWHLPEGHTAYLLAAEGVPRPSVSTEQKIPVIANVEYKFSGYFATQRANGLITLFCYDENHQVVGEKHINIVHTPDYFGGKFLKDYAYIEFEFTPVKGIQYIQFKIELGEQIDLSQANGYLFFTNLFFGVYDEIQELEDNKGKVFGKVKLPIFLKLKYLTVSFRKFLYSFNVNFKNNLITQTIFNNPKIGVFAIDHCFVIGEEGLLIYGWTFFHTTKLEKIFVHSDRAVIEISSHLFRVPRQDLVSEPNKQIFPSITEFSGFVCYVPIQVDTRQGCYIEFVLNTGRREWVKVSIPDNKKNGLALIKAILNNVSSPDRMRSKLYDLFDQHLGKVINVIGENRIKLNQKIKQRQFGLSPYKPTVSIIVPLYGRYDFMRHQLAHFVDDADFNTVDLIYVVDDPSILVATLETAIAYHQLFEKPFRVVWYNQNLGFAGANNAGVSVAKAEILLLLNSDVIPQQSGWLSTLSTALNELPNAGAVAPLLLFPDNSVQHAGMLPKHDPLLPKFLLNMHPGKGMPWLKSDEPTHHSLLTAACLMVRKSNYLKVGGLDEGYIIGDFEDSDFCLKLRKMGLDLWLVPEAKLWHLERQSQNLENISGHRQLITLYNGWRYHQKIVNGEIANPIMREV